MNIEQINNECRFLSLNLDNINEYYIIGLDIEEIKNLDNNVINELDTINCLDLTLSNSNIEDLIIECEERIEEALNEQSLLDDDIDFPKELEIKDILYEKSRSDEIVLENIDFNGNGLKYMNEDDLCLDLNNDVGSIKALLFDILEEINIIKEIILL